MDHVHRAGKARVEGVGHAQYLERLLRVLDGNADKGVFEWATHTVVVTG
jgi:hypothetical protein